MSARHLQLDSPALGRKVHVWCFGEVGQPVVVFPSNAGIAHEWRDGGMVAALGPLLADRRLKLYCPESNASQTFTCAGDLAERMRLHALYERFVLETLVPFVRADTRQPQARLLATGCSLGALLAALFALKQPEVFRAALCLSGRYRGAGFIPGAPSEHTYFNDPLAFVPNLEGAELERVRSQTHLTLVVGRGAHENQCVPETLELGDWLRRKDVPHRLEVWGEDSRHDYAWWQRQARHHLERMV
ncbi:MAG TPA: alpha/beta hydrolase-fold protein [Planctomycetota bacterium]